MKQSLKYFFLLVLFWNILPVSAQNRGILRGVVTDSTSGEALPYANIFLSEANRGATSDLRGYFVFASLAANQVYHVAISYVGYQSKNFIIRIEPYKVTDIKIKLVPASIELKTIEKIGERVSKENATDISLKRIALKDLETLPKGVELDIFRALQYMPGVQTTGDVSARYFVRGGASNENLVLLDNATVYNPFHALGIFSAIDPDMVNTVEFFKGGFPAEYTGRLSSVMRIVTKDGNKNRMSGKASMSFLTAKALLEGPIPGGSFMLTGRKNYTETALRKFLNNAAQPVDFYDLSFKLNLANDEFLKDAKFTVNAFISEDKINNNSQIKEDYRWSNKILGINYFQVSDSPLFYQVDVALSRFEGEKIPNLTSSKTIKNFIDDVTMRMDFNYVYDSKDELAGGFKITEIHSSLKLDNLRGIVNELGKHGTSLSAYLKYKYLRFSNFGADIGTRIHGTRLAGGGAVSLLEPRASITYRPVPEIAAKAAWGIYMQDLVTISDENEVFTMFEPWIITPGYLNPSNAVHYITGLEITPSQSLFFDLEGYYKLIHNLIIVNDNKYFQTDPDFITGKGESYGLEFQMNYRRLPVNLSLSYSLAWSFKEVNGVKFAPRYDSRHNLNVILEYDFGSGWTATASWLFASGLPFTQIAGYYDKLTISDLTVRNYMLDSYFPFTLLGERNIGRLPDYHRLDLGVSKVFQLGDFKIYADVSLLNVYNRHNIFYFKRDTGERIDMLPFLPSATIKVEL